MAEHKPGCLTWKLKAKWNKNNQKYEWWKKFIDKLNKRYLEINCELAYLCADNDSLSNPKILVEFHIWGSNVGYLACSNKSILRKIMKYKINFFFHINIKFFCLVENEVYIFMKVKLSFWSLYFVVIFKSQLNKFWTKVKTFFIFKY